MKKHTSKDAYYDRLKNLAEVNKKTIKESVNRSLGTLIDYKTAADGINYGIIKENHNYFIKKAGTKTDPNVSDFAYIGGLSNITNFQYKSLHEADKNRNMLMHTINEANNLKPNINGGKEKLNEDKADIEISNAESKLDDLDAATANAEPASDEIAAGFESEPASDDAELPAADVSEPDVETTDVDSVETEPANDDTGLPADGGTGEEEIETTDVEGEETTDDSEETSTDNVDGEEKDESTRELEKSIGKITNTIRKTDLEPSQSQSYLKSLIQSFKDKLPELEIEDRKEIANLILKVVPPEDMEDLGDTLPPDEIEEESCSECGSFGKYAESRGYGSADALRECGEDEVNNLVSGYANAHNDGMNDGDLEGVALVIKVINPNMLDSLKNEYGHDEYAEKLTPYVDGMNESNDDENLAKLDELFGGLKSLGGAAVSGIKKGGQAVGSAVKGAGQAISGVAKDAGQAIGGAAQKGVQAAKDAGTAISQTYHSGEVKGEIQKLEKLANDLGSQVASLNTRLTKAGQEPVDTQKLIAGISNQVRTGKDANVGGTTAGSGLQREGMTDPASIEVQPMIKEDDVDLDAIEDKTDEVGFAPEAQPLGGGVIKPDGAPTTGVDINVNPDKSVNISMNESELKVRKYIRARLEERAGLRKAVINEDKKSDSLKKLDKLIDEQFDNYKNVIKK